jgi:CHASE3 domain sensor protein
MPQRRRENAMNRGLISTIIGILVIIILVIVIMQLV